MMGVLPLVRFARRNLPVVEIAVGLRRELEAELIVGVLAFQLDLDIVQRDDARQRRDAAHELTELVIAAREADLDGQLGVEVALLLALRLKQLLLEPSGQRPGSRGSSDRSSSSMFIAAPPCWPDPCRPSCLCRRPCRYPARRSSPGRRTV